MEFMMAENRLAMDRATQARSQDPGSDETARLGYEAWAVSKLVYSFMEGVMKMKEEFETCSRRLGPRKDV
jgi:hypothetical protein